MDITNDSFLLLFKALSDEMRLQILAMLRDGELCACKIQERFRVSQPTLSYHMKILTQSGLVSCRKDGLWMRYSLRPESFALARNFLQAYSTAPEIQSIHAEIPQKAEALQ